MTTAAQALTAEMADSAPASEPLRKFLQVARGAGLRVSAAEGIDAARAVDIIGYSAGGVGSAAIQLAKAALRAGIELLLGHAGLSEVHDIRLAGAFGSHIDPVYALVLGLVPDCPVDSVRSTMWPS